MNNQKLQAKAHSTMPTLLNEKGYICSIDVLVKLDILSKEDYENWRFGIVNYLERVCTINLNKLSFINREIRLFAIKNNLKASFTYYKKWGKGNKIQLRFSKFGNPNIERLYATHYVKQNIKDTKINTKTDINEKK